MPRRHTSILSWPSKRIYTSAATLKLRESSSRATRLLALLMSTLGELCEYIIVGVELIGEGLDSDHGADKTIETVVRARKMVVLTSGTLSTPQV